MYKFRRPNSVRPNRINRDGPQGPQEGFRGQNPRSPLNGLLGDNRDDFQTQVSFFFIYFVKLFKFSMSDLTTPNVTICPHLNTLFSPLIIFNTQKNYFLVKIPPKLNQPSNVLKNAKSQSIKRSTYGFPKNHCVLKTPEFRLAKICLIHAMMMTLVSMLKTTLKVIHKIFRQRRL